MPLNPSSSALLKLIAAAVAPVVLITAAAILLSGYTTKYIAIGGQIRSLTAEYRDPATGVVRRRSLEVQLRFFGRRIWAVWAATGVLSLGLLCFLATVIFLVLNQALSLPAFMVTVPMMTGLLLMGCGVLLELIELHLARLSVHQELSDTLKDGS